MPPEPTGGPPAEAATRLLADGPSVINVGLESFATELASQDRPVVHVDWVPPAGGDARLARLLAKLST
jgi:FdrA protein